MANEENPFQVLARVASEHLRITHNAMANPARAEELLQDRMLDFLQDYVDGDQKTPEVDQTCSSINDMPGPMIRVRIKQHASERIAALRSRVRA